MQSSRWIPIVVSAALLCACNSAREQLPPPPTCTGCAPSGGPPIGTETSGSTGTGSGSGGNDGQGGGATATVSGSVVTVSSLAFDSVSPYTKPAQVYADGPAGKKLSQPYDAGTFTIDGVATGDTWFLVAPKDTSDTVFPTWSLQPIPADKVTDKLVLPLLDQQVLATIGLDAGLALSTLQAQIVLRVTDGKVPLAGVSAESAGAGLILYDLGATGYNAQTMVTAGRGIIVLLNAEASTTITLTDSAATEYSIDVRSEPGTATLLDLAL